MKRIIESKRDTSRALQKFREIIASVSGEPERVEWGFPNGDRAMFMTYTFNTAHGPLQIGIPDRWNNRLPHLLRFAKESGPPSPDVELNIPSELDRKVSGVYVETDKSIWIGTRGNFTAFRGKIPREIAFNYFKKWLIDVNDGNRQAQIIPIVSFDSPSICNDLGEFVRSVIELKQLHKQGALVGSTQQPSPWNDHDEFEGTKQTTISSSVDYEYLHGPLCNSLARHLRGLVSAHHVNFEIRKNRNVDVAIVTKNEQKARLIFEVKTSAALSPQIYSAIGQLAFYKHAYGDEKCDVAIALPKALRNEAVPLKDFLKAIEIHLIFGDAEGFVDMDSQPLKKWLAKLLPI